MADCNVLVVGGGVIGCAVAYEFSKDIPDVFLMDMNTVFPGDNQTARNSGVIHAGIYYDSPLKANLCSEGNKMLYSFCRKHDVPASMTGKLIVATDKEEDAALDDILLRATSNRIPIERLERDAVRELEPDVKAYSALWVPSSGIVEPTVLVRKLRELADATFLMANEVTDVKYYQGEFLVRADARGYGESEFSARFIINAAGLCSDRIARMVDPHFPLRILPVRGESAKFYKRDVGVSRNVYPVPVCMEKPDGSRHMTVGVHLTPTFSMNPDGSYAKKEEDYVRGSEITIGPLNRTGFSDYCSDLAEPCDFRSRIMKFFPHIREEDISLHQSGIQAVLSNGNDFFIAPDAHHRNMINLVGICSPGLTSSLAIARMVKRLVDLTLV
ncbi:MAG: NAD(P)/FAD-dependent oxidoreductase [Candidatus Nanoarchaeia archaeon]